ncbi:MAG: hypothetical protein HFH09_03060 [Bacilli bacterium]|nr:hypothetical protein [Bacilli bacterium]
MTVILLSPDGKKFELEWEDLLECSKQICEQWISESEENKRIFDSYASQYTLFTPYYDFLLHRLRYIQVGFPFFENACAIPSLHFKKIISLDGEDPLNYDYLKNRKNQFCLDIYTGSDKQLDYQKPYSEYKEGFLLPDGSLISIDQLGNHKNIAYAYLLQKMIEDPSLLTDYLNYKDKIGDIREYFFYRLGCAQTFGLECRVAIYDVALLTSIQRKLLNSMDLDSDLQNSILEEFQNPFTSEIRK